MILKRIGKNETNSEIHPCQNVYLPTFAITAYTIEGKKVSQKNILLYFNHCTLYYYATRDSRKP